MKKMGVLLVLLLIIVGVYKVQPYYAAGAFDSMVGPFGQKNQERAINNTNKPYYVKSGYKIMGYFDKVQEAASFGEKHKRSVVVDFQNEEWLWNNYQPFIIITEHGVQDFNTLESAIYYANRNAQDKIYWNGNTNVIWDINEQIPEKVILDVPVIKQYPELPRGCEVTSLAMIFQHMGISTNKLELAQEIKKDNTTYSKGVDGKITFGNPYNGFVGDMYNIRNNGYGVYHGPIAELAEQYLPNQVIDFTGVDFERLLGLVAKGMPVWVVANTLYKHLPEDMFEMWHTPTGIVKITYREHAVVVTGYSDKHVYINDPLKSSQNIKVDKEKFIEAWIQMGSQAVVIHKTDSQ